MRLDKYLKVSRLIKRRTVANEACDAGRVLVNDKPAKASVNVKEGDIIEIQFCTRSVKVQVVFSGKSSVEHKAEHRRRRKAAQDQGRFLPPLQAGNGKLRAEEHLQSIRSAVKGISQTIL